MALDSFAEYKVLQDYKNDLKKSIAKSDSATQQFRLVKDFEFSGAKGPLLIVGKPSGKLLEDLKKATVKAQGLCKLMGEKDPQLEFEVDKGTVVPNDITAAFKFVGSPQKGRVVAAFTDAAKVAQANNEAVAFALASKKRIEALALQLKKLHPPSPPLVDELKLLSALLEKGERGAIEDAFDAFEIRLATTARGKAPATVEEVGKHLASSAKNVQKPAVDKPEHGVGAEEALPALLTRLDTLEKAFGTLLADPNGPLLANKQLQALGTSLAALARQSKDIEFGQKVKQATLRLAKLAQQVPKLSPAEMQKHIESRQKVLGRDEGNAKDVPQEGEVGADVEMSVGGLDRSKTPEVEFLAGAQSPMGIGSEKEPPRQLDVFGLTPEVVRKLMLMHARSLYPGLKAAKDDDALWDSLRMLTGPGNVPVPDNGTSVAVDPPKIFKDYLDKNEKSEKSRSFLQSLEEHFAKGGKPTMVPFDVRGMSRWPALLSHVKAVVAHRFPKHQQLIIWRE